MKRWVGIALLCSLAAVSGSLRKKNLKATAVASAKEFDELIHKHITDEDRADRRRGVQAEVKAHTQRVIEIQKELDAVDTRHLSTASDYPAVFAKLDQAWTQTETRLAQLRFELLKKITPEEWAYLNAKVQAKIDKAPAKAEKKAATEKRAA